jgi:hypothetical protein
MAKASADSDVTGKETECTAYDSGFRDTPDIEAQPTDLIAGSSSDKNARLFRTTHSQGY